MNFIYAESLKHSTALCSQLSKSRMDPLPAPPNNGSRTATALKNAVALWTQQLHNTDHSTGNTLASFLVFLEQVGDVDHQLRQRLEQAL